MPECTIVFTRSARKELQRLPLPIAQRILIAIARLANNPRPPRARKLQGSKDLWRLRVGEYRVVYAIDDSERLVDVRIVRHRKDVYR